MGNVEADACLRRAERSSGGFVAAARGLATAAMGSAAASEAAQPKAPRTVREGGLEFSRRVGRSVGAAMRKLLVHGDRRPSLRMVNRTLASCMLALQMHFSCCCLLHVLLGSGRISGIFPAVGLKPENGVQGSGSHVQARDPGYL